MADSVSFGKFVIPTGYESEQAKIALKRKIADALLERGLQSNQGMRSPFEALGQLAQALSGKIMENKSASLEDALGNKIRGDYETARSGFKADEGTMTPQQLVDKYGDNPMLADDLKPYQDAVGEGLKNREGLVNLGQSAGFGRKGDYIGKPMPNDPNKPVWIDGQGNVTINPILANAHQYSNPNLVDPSQMPTTAPMPVPGVPTPQGSPPGGQPVPGGAGAPSAPSGAGVPTISDAIRARALSGAIGTVESNNRDFNPDGSPVRNQQSGAMYGMQVLPSTAHDPGFGVRPAANDSAAEYDRVGRDYAEAMKRRYGSTSLGLSAYNAGPGAVDKALQSGGPVPAQGYANKVMGNMKPPSGIAGGKPYWMINGIPYDNPEGQ